jgi:Pregnancy-associated plasma protein-A
MAKRKRARSGGGVRRQCGTMAAHMMLLERFPSYRASQMRLEAATARRRASSRQLKVAKLVTIKTVVNVVYNTDEQNISNKQINSQIAVLNRDFRATNPDRTQTPAVWEGLIGDTRLKFKLAKVTRTRTAKTSFTTDDAVKKGSTGGIAPYQPDKHLNVWVCPLGGGLLGYAQFPGGPAATDGVVINYKAFGTTGTAEAPFNLGRTATHEIGHYFNLRHIWADTPDCSGSDMVADTPNAAGPNFGKPSFPVVTCNNGPNGDMFMNYMDYVDDGAMFMFTAQQVLRMRTALDEARGGLT